VGFSSTRAAGFTSPEGSVDELLGTVTIEEQAQYVSPVVLVEENHVMRNLRTNQPQGATCLRNLYAYYEGVDDFLHERFDEGGGIDDKGKPRARSSLRRRI
jgi:hypothetical protein